MSHSFLKGILLLFIIWIPAENIKSQNTSKTNYEMQIVSYNIRYADSSSNDINSWNNRKSDIITQIQMLNPDIIGIQEALSYQIRDIKILLPDFGWTGKGRDDGDKKGEFCPIFYNENKFKLISSGTLWLSETPDVPSKGWDAALNRIVTYAEFQITGTNKAFYFFNTHFDHIGKEAREQSAELIINLIKEISKGYPVILTGDFNDVPGNRFYETITSHLNDANGISESAHQGPEFTFNGFNSNIETGNRIDYIFISSDIRVLSHLTANTKFGGKYPSDHFPVAAYILFK